MPIYMDYHIMDKVTIEKVKESHMIDLKIQEKHNVKYLQFWINEEAGTVFCLIEGPNPEACANVHREAHGNVACNIVEVESTNLQAFMGKENHVDHGIVYYNNGEIDSGFRFIMVLDIIEETRSENNLNLKSLKLPTIQRKVALEKIEKFEGNEIKNLSDDSIIAVFNNPNSALKCVSEIHKEFLSKTINSEWNIEFRIGLNEGQPLTTDNGFFEEATDYCRHLSLIANNQEVIVSKSIEKIVDFDNISMDNKQIKVISHKQEGFIIRFFKHFESNISNETFNVKTLSRDIGISRPQLYRKMISITGRSPINFIRDLKMRKALSLINQNKLNISEIASVVGYNNPSYFSKCFREKYGISPSRIG